MPPDPEDRGRFGQRPPIHLLHRGHSRYVVFGRKVADEWQNVGAMRADQLDMMLPPLLDQLLEDGFFSIHGFFTQRRERRFVSDLTACFADLDCYNVNLTAGQALGRVIDMQDAGTLPAVTLFCRSGRGLWAFWLLRDERDRTSPVRYKPTADDPINPWAMALWDATQLELFRRLADVGADPSRDASKMTRYPDSVNTKSGAQVRYMVQLDEHENIYTYGLRELADRLGVNASPPPRVRTRRPRRDKPTDEVSKVKRRGWQARAQRNLDNFRALTLLRGGFTKGARDQALLVYGVFLHCAGWRGEDLVAEARDFNRRECRPPLADHEVRAATKKPGKYARMGYDEIAARLKVSHEEAARLDRWPAYDGTKPVRPGDEERRDAKAAGRRQAILDLTQGGSTIPTLRALQAQLADIGISATLDTLKRDLAALRISNPRARTATKGQGLLF